MQAFIIFIITLTFCSCSIPAEALPLVKSKDNKPKLYKFKILKVLDGDTIKVLFDNLPEELEEVGIRIYGIDTPEHGSRAKCEAERQLAAQAKEFTQKLIDNGKKVRFSILGYDKYGGRVLGGAFIDDKSLSEELIKAGYAVEYYGEKKTALWCD